MSEIEQNKIKKLNRIMCSAAVTGLLGLAPALSDTLTQNKTPDIGLDLLGIFLFGAAEILAISVYHIAEELKLRQNKKG